MLKMLFMMLQYEKTSSKMVFIVSKSRMGLLIPYSSGFNYDKNKDYYMELDVSDPNFVYVTGGEMGIIDGTDGYDIYYQVLWHNLAKGASLDKLRVARMVLVPYGMVLSML